MHHDASSVQQSFFPYSSLDRLIERPSCVVVEKASSSIREK